MTTQPEQKIDAQADEACEACIAIGIEIPANPVEHRMQWRSSFVLNVASEWFLITAAHVLRHLEDAAASGHETRLFLLPYSAQARDATTFAFDRNRWLSTEDLSAICSKHDSDEAVITMVRKSDLASWRLSDYYRRHLHAAGVKPFSFEQIRLRSEAEAEQCFHASELIDAVLIGVPESTVRNSEEKANAWFGRLHIKPHHGPNAIEPPFTEWGPRWDNEQLPHDVTGMSGGPLVLLGLDQPYVIGVMVNQDRVGGLTVLRSANVFGFAQVLATIADHEQRSQVDTQSPPP